MGVQANVRSVEHLVLGLARLGLGLNQAAVDVVQDEEIVDNASVFVLCDLDLHGARRPGEIGALVGMTSGGVTKLVDRLEQRGLVVREFGSLQSDRRAVLVTITDEGRTLVRDVARSMARVVEARGIAAADLEALLRPFGDD